MQPRGQLWFQLEQVCRDFREFSGLPERDALQILVAVLRNMLGEQEQALAKLAEPGRPAQETEERP